MADVSLQIGVDVLRPLIKQIIREVVQELNDDREQFGGKLAYPLPEAAALLGVRQHVLRDARGRGELVGRLIGKKIVFSREELVAYARGEAPK